ncbi:GNAT family N-acetyltransferase [Streptomyces thermolineatus]|uniref:GNAT family N-acetyltransferase n=2 Tax=Streptomyces TaxID=1883 RepID=A0ABN3LA88_9ACTN
MTEMTHDRANHDRTCRNTHDTRAGLLARLAGLRPARSRRQDGSPPPAPDGTASDTAPGASHDAPGTVPATLLRLRTTVRDAPGSLASLCAVLARLGVDILTLQTHPLSDGTVDEFLVRAPRTLSCDELRQAVEEAGGRDTWMENADTHDLVDVPTRMLDLAARTALDAAELPLALRRLFGRCTIRSLPPHRVPGEHPAEDVLEDTVMRLRDPSGGSITVERPYLPFTPTEFARARALVELDARLGLRVPRARDVLTLAEGNEVTVRRGGPEDLGAAVAMHRRCSRLTLARRYHGPVKDADLFLKHLLSPRFGQTLVAEAADGTIVALAHLMWDGDETEIALMVEDDWQRRGIGGELLRRLVALARRAGCGSVYAVTQHDNTGMVAAMRGLQLPLDYQVEEGTLVITASLGDHEGQDADEDTGNGLSAGPVGARPR